MCLINRKFDKKAEKTEFGALFFSFEFYWIFGGVNGMLTNEGARGSFFLSFFVYLLGGYVIKIFLLFSFRTAKAADAESLRLLFIQLPILNFLFGSVTMKS